MTLDPHSMLWILVGGGLVTLVLLVSAFGDDIGADLKRRLGRVSAEGTVHTIDMHDRKSAVRDTRDSGIPLLNALVQFLPNPNKLRARLARTGRTIALGEYLLMNALAACLFFLLFRAIGWGPLIAVPLALMLGLGLPHMITGIMGGRRIKKFLASFPEAIDTMCRGVRSGLPVTESIASVGREMPDPVGLEFRRIADGVRVGKTLESAMWEITRRIDSPEFRFLIIAMAIQKETGGNLAETLGNLSELIRRRRQLRLKIKAMSAEARASAMIIGSLPFIMFTLLMVVNSGYMLTMFHSLGGKLMLGAAFGWMCIGWAAMTKMIHFEI